MKYGDQACETTVHATEILLNGSDVEYCYVHVFTDAAPLL